METLVKKFLNNRNFIQKSKCMSKIRIFAKKSTFQTKYSKFWSIIEILTDNGNNFSDVFWHFGFRDTFELEFGSRQYNFFFFSQKFILFSNSEKIKDLTKPNLFSNSEKKDKKILFWHIFLIFGKDFDFG